VEDGVAQHSGDAVVIGVEVLTNPMLGLVGEDPSTDQNPRHASPDHACNSLLSSERLPGALRLLASHSLQDCNQE